MSFVHVTSKTVIDRYQAHRSFDNRALRWRPPIYIRSLSTKIEARRHMVLAYVDVGLPKMENYHLWMAPPS